MNLIDKKRWSTVYSTVYPCSNIFLDVVESLIAIEIVLESLNIQVQISCVLE